MQFINGEWVADSNSPEAASLENIASRQRKINSPTPLLTTDQFDYNPKTQTFSAEASDLRDEFSTRQVSIRSAETGAIKTFVHVETLWNHSGEGVDDIQGWEYRSGKFNLIIWND